MVRYKLISTKDVAVAVPLADATAGVVGTSRNYAREDHRHPRESDSDFTTLATKESPTFTGTPAAPTASPGTNTTQIATTAFVQAAFPHIDALVYKGVIACAGNPNFPAANAGDVYKISTAGKIGGVSGVVVEVGDVAICGTDASVEGTQAAVGANWDLLQTNVDGAVTGPASATDNAIVRYDLATGKLIQNSLITVDDAGSVDIPSGQKYKINNTALAAGDITGAAPLASPTFTGVVTSPTFDTGVAEAAVTLSGVSLVADGTDAAIDINITPKGTGEVNLPKVDIDAGAIDGCTIATSNVTVGSGKTLDVSDGTLTLADNQISGDKIEGGTINSITINTLSGTPAAATAAPDTNTTQLATCAFVVGQAPTLAYGAEWDPGATNSPILTRVDSNGVTITPNTADFNAHPIWGRIRRCNLSDAGVVTAYYGDAHYATDGSNGQVMVQIPRFYYLASKTGTKYRWTICDKKLPGYKVHPDFVSDGVEKPYTYIGAFQGSAYDVTASATEVNTITVTAEPTSSGNLTITLDGNYAFTVAILDADTIEGVVDKIVAAGNKTDFQGVVWTVSKVDASNVRYTAGSAGLKTTVTMPTACGVTATIVKTTAGAGGYVLNGSAGVSFTGTTGDKLCSVAGVKPMSGWNNATATLPNFRVLANNRGTGWGLQTFNQISAIQLLYLIEYATFQSQTAIGAGVTTITDATAGTAYNNAINNGYTAGVGTNAVSLGNATGEAASVTHYKTGEAAKAMSYRGIENFYGNMWTWVDGINLASRRIWIADHGFVEDTFTHPYIDTGITNCASDGYPTDIGFSSTFDYGFIASSVAGSSPSSTTYFCDYYYQEAGNKSALLGGGWYNGAYAGTFFLCLNGAGSNVDRDIGARLRFCP